MELIMPSVSLIIPTLNAGPMFGAVLDAVFAQTMVPTEVLVIDSSSDDSTVEIAKATPARITVIPREEFCHGGTRHDAFLQTSGDIVCFLNQDALPADDSLIARLVEALLDPLVVAAFARQLPYPGDSRTTQLVQAFNYPARSEVRDHSQVRTRGIRAFFFSDVCAAYRRTDYLDAGGFERTVPCNEDMLMCARLLHAGKRIAYVADACVYHSNRLSLVQQFRRDLSIGRFCATYGDELEHASEVDEGKLLVREVATALLDERRVAELASFVARCVVRLAGNRLGRAGVGA